MINRRGVKASSGSQKDFERFEIFGGHSYEETPVPIPNTEVKLVASKILAGNPAGTIDTARLILLCCHPGLVSGSNK